MFQLYVKTLFARSSRAIYQPLDGDIKSIMRVYLPIELHNRSKTPVAGMVIALSSLPVAVSYTRR